ncbi:MAG TPA: dephospho-CoA kinase [Lacibacter sp.]|nr:dephospho-CoA kinase [Lacibacter sp.]HMO89177.1 dephospho-CoA kinase [Lacibacter sp.]HMP87419.1 dephospho-CoA kinase [Lacibacter sp.]
MLKIGLTGGIGSGKSTVARLFELLGIPVYRADAAAKRLMETDPALMRQIRDAFGEASYSNGRLNRTFLAQSVFGDKSRLETLNNLVHPVTIADAEKWFAAQKGPYVLKEAALLFESGTAAGLDFIIGVEAPRPLRIRRTMLRDGVGAAAVEQRMQHQIDETIKMRLCDFVIRNNEQELVIPQVLALHQQLLTRAQNKEAVV